MNALYFLVDTFSRLYLLTFLLRIMLQVARADFYNPISQFILRVTNPLVVPARRLLPSLRSFDLPTLVVLIVVQMAVALLLLALRGVTPSIGVLVWFTVFALIRLTISTYFICILVYVVLSWLAQATYSPIAMLLGQIVEPMLRPARRLIPPIGGIDVSPMIVMILLMAVSIAVNDLANQLLR